MFSYQARLRVTPPAGPAVVYDLTAIQTGYVARAFYEPIAFQKETLNHGLRNIAKGWRPRAFFAWYVEAGSADEDLLVAISLAINRGDTTVELSMDAGARYREVVFVPESWRRYTPEDKNIGAIYEIEFAASEILNEDSLPPETLTGPPGIAGWA